MKRWSNFYIVRIAFLGYRFHGWQKQPGLKTLHGMVDKTIKYVLQDEPFQTLGCARTDAMVSADDYAFELFTNQSLQNDTFLYEFDLNLPPDIQAKSIKVTDSSFNIIQSSKLKTYHYYFVTGKKPLPHYAPFIGYFKDRLNIEAMKNAATLLEGEHDFKLFVSRPSEKTVTTRAIESSSLSQTNRWGMFCQDHSCYVFQVNGRGFMRHQVRLMFGALLEIGKETRSLSSLADALKGKGEKIKTIAPASGLRLHKIQFED